MARWALWLVLLTASVARAGFDEELEKIRRESQMALDKAGADREALIARHQVELPRPFHIAQLEPGEKKTAVIRRVYPPSVRLLVRRGDVKLLAANPAKNATELVLKASPAALPGPVSVVAVSNVSGEWAESTVAVVTGRALVELDLENGWRVKIEGDLPDSAGNFSAATSWFEKGEGAPFRRAQVAFGPGEHGLDGMLLPDDSLAKTMPGYAVDLEKAAADGKYEARMEAIAERMGTCRKRSAKSQDACMEEALAEMRTLSDEASRAFESVNEQSAWGQSQREFGCTTIRLEWKRDVLVGEVLGCFGKDEPITATAVRVLR